jgi:hypothetical protein
MFEGFQDVRIPVGSVALRVRYGGAGVPPLQFEEDGRDFVEEFASDGRI